MKKILFIFFFSISLLGYTQDKIYKLNNEQIETKILEVTNDEIKYKKFNYLDGPTISISKDEVVMIIYQNGDKDIFTKEEKKETLEYVDNSSIENISPAEMFELGRKDAAIKYKSYKPFWGSFVATTLFAPAGIVTALIIGSTRPKPEFTNPDRALIQNRDYYLGYRKTMKSKKWGRAWGGFGIGIATNVLTYYLIYGRR